MSLNWKEIALILEEAKLDGCKIQAMVQGSFHSVTWQLYSKEKGRFSFYTEVGTPLARMHLVSQETKPKKTAKLQRFEQFARKNLEGSVIVSCVQMPFDRLVVWDLVNHDRKLKVWTSLYSGPGANIIVTDENNRILDLMLRRPGRDEVTGNIFQPQIREKSDREFTVREHEGSFNAFIERTCGEDQQEDELSSLLKKAQSLRERESARLETSLRSARKTLEENSRSEELRYEADLLSANTYLIRHGDDHVDIKDWANDRMVRISLDKALSPGANVQALYDRYQKAKGAAANAKAEMERLEAELSQLQARFDRALQKTDDKGADIARLKALVSKFESSQQTPDRQDMPGIRCETGGFTIIAGRNAKENDELLRHYAKPADLWLHTREFPGGYVFIRFRKDKTVPLDVLLVAANIAILYSKGRNQTSVDLYYTQVRYLRRAKDGKTGLVLPTQEKNLTVKPDFSRLAGLLPRGEFS